ncbi:MAG: sigma 54-interacting transcriptional regulator [Myxococcales bacterium]
MTSSSNSGLVPLVQASHALMNLTDAEQVLSAVADSALQLFAAEACSLSLYDRARDELVFFLSQGPASVAPFRIPADQGIAGQVFRTGISFCSNDVAAETSFFSKVDETSGHRTRSMICCPIARGGERLGTLQVLNTGLPSGFASEHTQWLEVLAGMVGATVLRTRVEQAARDGALLLRDETERRYQLVAGQHEEMARQLRTLERAAKSKSTVLLLGESGVGKELAARAVHAWSDRSDKPFVVINCVALSPTLLESELFGHERGAFTGAIARKRGKFEFADGGTLFLDEVGELPLEVQTKLLRVLQDGEIQRVGGNETLRPDVRLLAATNRDLKQAIQEGRFRKDLFYRLNVISVTLPPLRERRTDIDELAQHLLQRACREQKRPGLSLGRAALAHLRGYAWPGNVRELANVIERAVVLCEGNEITPQDLPEELRDSVGEAEHAEHSETSGPGTLADQVAATKRRAIAEALAQAEGNQAQAARTLGLHPSNLSRLMKQLGSR